MWTSTAPGILRISSRSRVAIGIERIELRPLDLDVDRRGKPEVEHLRDDVGRLEIERDAGVVVARASSRSRRW